MTRHAVITGIGSYLPDTVLSNSDLEKMVDTSDEWIVTRTGIRERRVVAPSEATSDLAIRAVERAIERAGIAKKSIDMLIVATATPDRYFPSTACLMLEQLGLSCPAFDMNAACSGFIYAIQTATSMIEAGRADTVVVVGAEALTRRVDFTDRATCVLFGDGAGAAVLQASDEPGVLSVVLGADGSGADLITVWGGGTARPLTAEDLEQGLQYMKMAGHDVYKFACRMIPKVTLTALEESGHTVDDLAWLVPHQANKRILDSVQERLSVDSAHIYNNVEPTGNTSAASIPIALDDLYTNGQLKPGDLVALAGFGSGLTFGAAVLRWSMPVPEEEIC
ncbi:MAG: beta-ketoacyl-ACP synthase III [Coriobacteriia bacterium]